MIDQAAESFIKGLFLNQHCALGDRISCIDFTVSRIEASAPPFFTDTMIYSTRSPVCLSTKGEKHAQYMHPADENYGKFLVNNLLEKFKVMPMALSGKDEPHLESSASFKFKLRSEPKSRLITLKAFTEQQTQVRGYDFKFELTAPDSLHEVGYYGGFGEKGSLGFGCAGVA